MTMNGNSRFAIPLIWLFLVIVGMAVAHFKFEAAWGVCAIGGVLAVGTILLNGWLMQWEDEEPGGFNNPTPNESEKDSRKA